MPENYYIGMTKFRSPTEPVKGYKRANLAMDKRTGRISITSIQAPDESLRSVSFNAESLCPQHEKHNGNPSKYCSCGFYSYKELKDAYTHLHYQERKQSVLLHTISSGKIIMYSRGVRAGKQRVTEIVLDSCFEQDCSKPADRFTLINTENSHLAGSCARHSYAGSCTFTFDKIAEKINDSFTNGEPDVAISMFGGGKPWKGNFDLHKNKEAQEYALLSTVVSATAIVGLRIFRALR